MATSVKKYPFTQKNVDNAPDKSGVYALYDQNEVIYIGRARGEGVTIRSRLKDHKSGKEGTCTKGASHYKRQATVFPLTRETALLVEYKKVHGKLPRCNERAG